MFDKLSVAEERPEEVNVIGHPSVVTEDIRPIILLDMDDRGQMFGSQSRHNDEKKREWHCYSNHNPAAPRMSGTPLIYNNHVIGLLTGSLPLLEH